MDVIQELDAIIQLGEVYFVQKFFGEAYHEMMQCKVRAEQVVQQQFCPTGEIIVLVNLKLLHLPVEYYFAKCMFLLSKISFELGKEDAENYLKSASVRTEELLRAISPHSIQINGELIQRVCVFYKGKILMQC